MDTSEKSNPDEQGNLRTAPAEPLISAQPSDEPFPCPACGQMLAADVRVCVVCKQPIDPTQIRRPDARPPRVEIQRGSLPLPRARFSWRIFFLVLSSWLLVAGVAQWFLGPTKSQLALGGVVILTSIWVFFDAEHRGVPKPLRWGIGSLMLWILVFPWYLARRRQPQAPCPFVEAEAGPLARLLFLILLTFFILSAVLVVFKGSLK